MKKNSSALFSKTVQTLGNVKKRMNQSRMSNAENDKSGINKNSALVNSKYLEKDKTASHINKSPILSEKSEFENDSWVGSEKGSFKEMIENASVDQKVLNLIGDTIELFNERSLNSVTKDEKERYELIEKSQLEKLKRDNEEYKTEKHIRTEEFNELIKQLNKYKGDLNVLTQSYNVQQNHKSDYLNKIYHLEDSLKELILGNNKLEEMINKERVEKDNIFRALVTFTRKNNYKLPNPLKEIYQNFNNDYYANALNVNKSHKIEILKSRIENLKAVLDEKKSEISKKKEIVKINIEKRLIQE